MTPAASVPQFEPVPDGGSGAAERYNQALFGQFMPGFDQPVVSVDSSRAGDGILEVRHEDGSGTAFYDRAVYQAPRGDYHVYEDSVAASGMPFMALLPWSVGPSMRTGNRSMKMTKLQTFTVETVRYKSTPARYSEPKKRPVTERKPPNRKKH